jgi:hypothetical protein
MEIWCARRASGFCIADGNVRRTGPTYASISSWGCPQRAARHVYIYRDESAHPTSTSRLIGNGQHSLHQRAASDRLPRWIHRRGVPVLDNASACAGDEAARPAAVRAPNLQLASAILTQQRCRLSVLWGQGRHLREAEAGRYDGAADIFESWVDQYGSVFTSPGPLGMSDVVVTDPKAVAHIYAGMEVCWCGPAHVCADGGLQTTYDQTKFRAREVGALVSRHEALRIRLMADTVGALKHHRRAR